MKHVFGSWWFKLGGLITAGLIGLLACCMSYRVWSLGEVTVYQAMAQECHPGGRGRHFGRIRGGDPVEEVIARTQPPQVKRAGDWSWLYYKKRVPGQLCFTGLTVGAYEGRLVCAFAWSDTWLYQFFDVMTEEQRAEFA